MGRPLWTIVAAVFLAAAPSSVRAQEKLDAMVLAARIDQALQENWKGALPAPPADDAEFLRRVYLDLAGRIPRVREVRDFLEDRATERRQRVVEHLLESPRHVRYFSATWLKLLLPSTESPEVAAQGAALKPWLEEQVRANTPYDKMVRDLLAAPLTASGVVLDGGRDFGRRDLSPAGFLLAQEQKPENAAANTARLFLGVKLECAQCHDHPFARWSRAQFWEMAAFFRDLEPQAPPSIPQESSPDSVGERAQPKAAATPRTITIPGIGTVVRARFLTDQDPDWPAGAEPRAVLAKWLTARDNPYFARTAVNRLWAHFFGLGLMDPLDDEPTEENPLRHPQLLAELSAQFIAHDYDVKYLIRALTATRAYQRTSSQTHASQADLRAFARMAVRGLSAEQVFDSFALATGIKEPPRSRQARPGAPEDPNTARADFLNRFVSQERPTEKQTSILQALALMNGVHVADATSLERGATLAAIADAPFLNVPQKIETLYLATLSRLPRPEESQRLSAYVTQGGPHGNEARALGDVLWALLNSSEFISNH